MKINIFAAAMCGATALAGTAAAQFSPDRQSGYTVQELGSVISGMNYNGNQIVLSGRTTDMGNFYYLASIPNTQQGFAIGGIGCQNTERRCEGMGIATFMEGTPSLGTVNDFNVNENYGKVSLPAPGVVRLVNEQIVFGGVSALNIRASVTVFINKLNLVEGKTARSAEAKIDAGRDSDIPEAPVTVSARSTIDISNPVFGQLDLLMDQLAEREATVAASTEQEQPQAEEPEL